MTEFALVVLNNSLAPDPKKGQEPIRVRCESQLNYTAQRRWLDLSSASFFCLCALLVGCRQKSRGVCSLSASCAKVSKMRFHIPTRLQRESRKYIQPNLPERLNRCLYGMPAQLRCSTALTNKPSSRSVASPWPWCPHSRYLTRSCWLYSSAYLLDNALTQCTVPTEYG